MTRPRKFDVYKILAVVAVTVGGLSIAGCKKAKNADRVVTVVDTSASALAPAVALPSDNREYDAITEKLDKLIKKWFVGGRIDVSDRRGCSDIAHDLMSIALPVGRLSESEFFVDSMDAHAQCYVVSPGRGSIIISKVTNAGLTFMSSLAWGNTWPQTMVIDSLKKDVEERRRRPADVVVEVGKMGDGAYVYVDKWKISRKYRGNNDIPDGSIGFWIIGSCGAVKVRACIAARDSIASHEMIKELARSSALGLRAIWSRAQ